MNTKFFRLWSLLLCVYCIVMIVKSVLWSLSVNVRSCFRQHDRHAGTHSGHCLLNRHFFLTSYNWQLTWNLKEIYRSFSNAYIEGNPFIAQISLLAHMQSEDIFFALQTATCCVFDYTFYLLIVQRALSSLNKKLRNMMKGLILFFFLPNCCPPALMTELNAVLV